jgi:hypothetical protein
MSTNISKGHAAFIIRVVEYGALVPSERLVSIYQATRRHIAKDGNIASKLSIDYFPKVIGSKYLILQDILSTVLRF